jgi:hypothetical protein
MAGSLEKFVYVNDRGQEKILNLDESNCLAIGSIPATATTGAGLELATLSGNERYLVCSGQTADGKPVSRRIVVPTPTNTFFLNGGTLDLPVLVDGTNGTVELVEFTITQTVAERKRFPKFGNDTGLDDGTV